MADHRSMRTVVDAIEEMKIDLSGPAVPSSLLVAVERLVPSAEVAFLTMDPRRRRLTSQQLLVDGVEKFSGDGTTADQHWWFLAAASSTTVSPRVCRTRAVQHWTAGATPHQIGSWPLCQHSWQGAGDLIWVDFPSCEGRERRLLLWRDAPDYFSAEDEAVVRLLRPHLFEVDHRARRRREDPRLTAREWQVLELVAQGASNAEVATALVTSVATVRKHMEHIFDRTGVRNRGAAVAAVMPLRETVDDRSLRG